MASGRFVLKECLGGKNFKVAYGCKRESKGRGAVSIGRGCNWDLRALREGKKESHDKDTKRVS